MKALWQAWYGHLSDATCDEIIKEAQKYNYQNGVVGGRNLIDPSIRDSQIKWIPKAAEEFKPLYNMINEYFEEANMNAFGVDTRVCENIQFTTYHSERKGHYNWHTDVFWESNNVYDRKLSMVIQLSNPEEYTGGELELDVHMPPDKDKLKERGTIIVFPSFVHHRVLPVISGTRHSLVVWKNGPTWR